MESLAIMDFTVVCGHRSEELQNKAFKEGRSKLEWPYSKHNRTPSLAVDIAPYPIDWNDKERFYFLAGVMKAMAYKHDIGIRWGGDWKGDNDFKNNSFNDLVHFELINLY
jgi:peptidoglycan L-alanyl-D-glutamate endopeptidase CwlK